MKSMWTAALIMLAGILVAGLAVFAQQLGLDQNAGWGRGRIAILVFGLLMTLLGAILRVQSAGVDLLHERVKSFGRNLPLAQTWSNSRIARSLALQKPGWAYLLAVLAASIIIIIYIWFISVGFWTTWPKTTFTYDLLASAFMHGQVALDYKPDPALLAMSDPYDTEARGNTPVLWDASLYNGKYYLYFGPVPGLILTAAKIVFPRQIADQYLVFAFSCGLLAFEVLLLISLWSRFFRESPIWTVPVSIFLVGFVCPIPWMLSRPAAYEAAIASSQFFFIGGLYFVFSALGAEWLSAWKLSLAGIFWILAIGSRTTTLIPVMFMILMLVWWLIKSRGKAQTKEHITLNLAALGLPLGIGASVLGWYNWARFGSPLESGFRFQLTWINLHKYYNETFSLGYLLPNLYNYLVNPFEVMRLFPFLKPLLGQAVLALHLNVPDIYRSEQVTGLLFGAPFVLLAMIPVLSGFSCETSKLLRQSVVEDNKPRWLLFWFSTSLTGSVVLSFAFLLLFFYSTMRYLADAIPSLALLSCIGFWRGCQWLARKPPLRAFYSLASLGLAVFSIIVSLLLAVTSYDERFRHLNRPLLEQLIRFFGR